MIETPAPANRRIAATFGLSFAAYFAVVLGRSVGLAESVWAEDGTIFLQGALDNGIRALGDAYGGYLHLVPRVISVPLASTSLERYPEFALVIAGLIWAATATLLNSCLTQVTRRPLLGFAAGLCLVLVPSASVESLANIATLHFALLAGLLVAVTPEWKRHGAIVAVGVFALVVSLSSPIAVVALPLVAYRYWTRSTTKRQAVTVTTAVLAGLVVQAITYIATRSGRGVNDWSPRGWLTAIRRWELALVPSGLETDYLTPAIVTAALAALFLILWQRRAFDRDADVRDVLAFGLLSSAVLVQQVEYFLGGAASRYHLIPTALLAIALLLLLSARDVAGTGLLGTAQTALAGVMMALLIVAAVSSFPPTDYRRSGPEWEAELRRAEEECAADAGVVELGVAPAVEPGNRPWGRVEITCEDLAERS